MKIRLHWAFLNCILRNNRLLDCTQIAKTQTGCELRAYLFDDGSVAFAHCCLSIISSAGHMTAQTQSGGKETSVLSSMRCADSADCRPAPPGDLRKARKKRWWMTGLSCVGVKQPGLFFLVPSGEEMHTALEWGNYIKNPFVIIHSHNMDPGSVRRNV